MHKHKKVTKTKTKSTINVRNMKRSRSIVGNQKDFKHKTAIINTRIEPKLKIAAEQILDKVGLNSAEAIRLFYKHVCLQKGLPFAVNIPTEETIEAMQQADKRKTHKAKNVDEIFENLD